MINPFEAGLPRQEVKKRAIKEYETKEGFQGLLSVKDLSNIKEYLKTGCFLEADEILANNKMNKDDWRIQVDLLALLEKLNHELFLQGDFKYLEKLADFTGVKYEYTQKDIVEKIVNPMERMIRELNADDELTHLTDLQRNEIEASQTQFERLKIANTWSIWELLALVKEQCPESALKYISNRLIDYNNTIHDNKDSIMANLRQDLLQALMIGSPEIAIYKITAKQQKKNPNGSIANLHFPLLYGERSGISEESVGVYKDLHFLYIEAVKEVHKIKGDDISDASLEYRAVRLAAERLNEAMNYQDPYRVPGSPYVTGILEATAWARLGHDVKSQLRGMRRKIQNIKLYNIKRFIGKSADVDKRLVERLKTLEAGLDKRGSRRGFRATPRGWGGENRLLIDEINEVKAKIETRKSLAEKAIDLHFVFREFNPSDLDAYIINEASFGSIERSHKGLRSGMEPIEAYSLLMCERFFKRADYPRDVYDEMQKILNEDRAIYNITNNKFEYYIEQAKNILYLNYDLLDEEMIRDIFQQAEQCLRNDIIAHIRSYEEVILLERLFGKVDFTDPLIKEVTKDAINDACIGFLGFPRDGFKKIIDYIGFNPFENDDLKQTLYRKYLRLLESYSVTSILILLEATKIKIPNTEEHNSAVQKLYHYLISVNKIDRIDTFKDSTGINIEESEELAFATQKGYAYIIDVDIYSPSEYRKRLLTGIFKLESATGVKPNFDTCRDKIESIFSRLLERGSMDNINILQEITGIDYKEALKRPILWRNIISNQRSVEDLNKKLQNIENNLEDFDKEKIESMIQVALPEAYSILLNNNCYEYVGNLAKKYNIHPSKGDIKVEFFNRFNSLESLNENLLSLVLRYRVPLEIASEELKKIRVESPRLAAIIHLIGLPKDKKEQKKILMELSTRAEWMPIVPDLLQVQGVALRQEFCPWENEFNPLISKLNQKYDFTNEIARTGLLDYVKRFGMKNLPILASICIELILAGARMSKSPGGKFVSSDLSTQSRAILEQFWRKHNIKMTWSGIKSQQDIETILGFLESRINDIQKQLLNDELPAGLENSPLEMELFNTLIVKSGSYGNVDDRSELIATWRKTKLSGQFGSTVLPGMYRASIDDRTYRVPKKSAEGSFEAIAVQLHGMNELDAELLEKRAKIISQIEEEKEVVIKNEELVLFLKPLQQALLNVESNYFSLDPKLLFADVFENLKNKIEILEKRLKDTSENETNLKKRQGIDINLTKLKETQELLKLLIEDNGVLSVLMAKKERLVKEGQNKEAEKVADLVNEFTVCTPESSEGKYIRAQAILESLCDSFGEKAYSLANSEINTLLMLMMSIESAGHAEDVHNAQQKNRVSVDEEIIRLWAKWYQEELAMHFTNPDNAHQTIRKIGFSNVLNKISEKFLGLTNQRKDVLDALTQIDARKKINHPLVRANSSLSFLNDKINTLRDKKLEEITESNLEVVDLTFNPCHGLGRIFAGDIGNACYDKLRLNLAKNEYPDLHAVLITSNTPGSKSVEMLGSVLFIHGLDVHGKRCIAIRALNPTVKALKNVHQKQFIEKTIQYAIKVAKAGALDKVLICVDNHSGGHGSNVKDVFDEMVEMQKNEGWKISVNLQSTSETNFNGYSIWATEGQKVYMVWERDRNEK